MKPPHRTAVTVNGRPSGRPRKAALLGLFAFALAAQAQDVVAPRPLDELVPGALQQAQAAQNIVPSAAVPTYAPDTPVFQSGPTTVRTHFFYRFVYGDGIPSSNGHHETTAIHNVAPELLVDLGTHWTVDYIPTWVFYSNSAFKDTVDQSFRVAGWAAYEDWVLQLSLNYATSSSPLVETGVQTKQETWSNSFRTTYSFNSKLAMELTALHAFQSAETFTSSHEWSTMDWLHYKIAPRLDTAVGLGLGYVNVSKGTDMTYDRPQVQVTWSPTEKIVLSAHGGMEDRKFLSSSEPDLHSPTYGGSIQYQPIETTKLTFTTEREVAASYFEDQITKGTRMSGQLEQRLLKEFYLSVGVSRQKVDYVPLAGSTALLRSDNNYSFNARLSTTLFRRCTATLLYQESHNSSTIPGYAQSSSQVGFELGFRY